MAEKRHSEAARYQVVPHSSIFFSEATKEWLFPSVCFATLTILAFFFVNLVLNITRDASQPNLDKVFRYVIIILGYLLLPGVGVLIVRRKRCLARNTILLMADTDIADAQFMDAFGGKTLLSAGMFGTRQVMRDIDKVTKCVTWGAADGKEVQCSVCLDGVQPDNEVRVLPCSHVFHKACADLWLVNGRKNSCPLCMQRICADRGADMSPVRR